ncbi:hypothetical protein COCOBI_05-6750 [Coccomyxa sp. Obi]|nr:hypothetical protein COCOBI_05-6750 [Coccomyxa sp. Obi]
MGDVKVMEHANLPSSDLVPYDPSKFEGYKGPPLPPDEDARCRTLEALALQPEVDDPVLSSLCKLLCSLLKIPAAAVSIVERERQVLKSTGGTMPRTIVPRSASFCQHTFVHKLPVVMVVEDTFKDERFANNPLVCRDVDPIRFYAGAPLIASNGHRLGAMCLIDQKPRTLTVEDYRILCNCAEMVVRRLEKQQVEVLEVTAVDGLLRSLDALRQPLLLLDMGARGWPILHANEAWTKSMALSKGTEIRAQPFWDYYEATPDSEDAVINGFNEQVSQLLPFDVTLQLKEGCNSGWPLHLHFKPATDGSLDAHAPPIAIPEGIPSNVNAAEDLPYYVVTIVDDEDATSAPAQPVPAASTQEAAPEQEKATPQNGMPPAFSNDSALVSNATGAKGEDGAAEHAAAEKVKGSSGEGVKAAPPTSSDQAAAANSQKGGCCGCTIC